MQALIAIILLLPTAVFCQGRFTTGDASSLGIGAGLSLGDNTTAMNFTLGTSLAGMVDGFVGMSLGNVDEDEFGEDIGSTEFGAGLTVRPTQPTPEVPLIVELSVGASHASLHSDTFDDFEIDLTGTGWTFGLAVGARLVAGPNMMIVPMFTVLRFDGTAKAEDRFGDSIEEDFDNTAISLATSLVFGSGGPQSFVLSPALSRDDDGIAFRLSAEVVFSGESNVQPRSPRARYGEPTRPAYPATMTPTREPLSQPLTVPSVPVRWVRPESLLQIAAAVPDWNSVKVGQLSEPMQDALADLFEVPRQSMGTFRHGKSAAPSSHAHHGSSWFTISVEDDSYSGTITLIISPDGRVIESKSRPR